jgi:RNA polymerase sigma-70 factor (ECF subfamily)
MASSTSIPFDSALLDQLNDPATRSSAFAAFYDALSRPVYVYALRMTGCANDAADVTQETFINVHKHLCRGNTIVDPLPFCLMIARQRILNIVRDKKDVVDVEDSHLVSDPYPQIFSADIAPHLERVVSLLPVVLRDAFVLRYYDGLSYDAMAELSKESSGTVRMRVQRAKAILRSKLSHLAGEVRR